MKHFVLGYDEGNLIIMTRKEFGSIQEAEHYARGCGSDWRAFVVSTIDEPVAWRWLYNGEPDSDKCFAMPGPDADVIDRAAKAEFPRTVEYLYKM